MKKGQKKKSVHWQVSTLFSKAVDENISSPKFYQKGSHFVKRIKGGRNWLKYLSHLKKQQSLKM